jgi:hypothetical protein
LQRVVSRSQDPEFGVELGRNNIVEWWTLSNEQHSHIGVPLVQKC